MIQTRTLIIFLVLLTVFVLAAFWFGAKSPPFDQNADISPPPLAASPVLNILVRHSVAKGIHTYAGEVTLPVCGQFASAGINIAGREPARVIILLDISKISSCTESVDESRKHFTLWYKANRGTAPVFDGVMVNNMLASSTLVEE